MQSRTNFAIQLRESKRKKLLEEVRRKILYHSCMEEREQAKMRLLTYLHSNNIDSRSNSSHTSAYYEQMLNELVNKRALREIHAAASQKIVPSELQSGESANSVNPFNPSGPPTGVFEKRAFTPFPQKLKDTVHRSNSADVSNLGSSSEKLIGVQGRKHTGARRVPNKDEQVKHDPQCPANKGKTSGQLAQQHQVHKTQREKDRRGQGKHYNANQPQASKQDVSPQKSIAHNNSKHPQRKDEVCKRFLRGAQFCRDGAERCRYIHPELLRTARKCCNFYCFDKCKKGDRCGFPPR